jgi:hypothetical protein
MERERTQPRLLFRLVNCVRACVLLEHGQTTRRQGRRTGDGPRPRRHSSGQLTSLKGEADAWLRDPNYGTP